MQIDMQLLLAVLYLRLTAPQYDLDDPKGNLV